MRPNAPCHYCLCILFFMSLFSLPISINSSSNVTAVFTFGDSTVDPGNNNHINTIFKADHLPYGRDFPRHVPTGRFCNGKLATDYIVSFLALKDVLPAYVDPTVRDNDLLTGVSFASAGTGLDDLTANLSKVLRMETQLKFFNEALRRMKRRVGEEEANRVIKNAMFLISIGTNDMIFNFYDIPTRRIAYSSISNYHDFLLRKLESSIWRLYNAGARRIVLAGLPPIGCLPFQVTLRSIKPSVETVHRVCVSEQNIDSQYYNKKLQTLILNLRSKLRGANVVYMDIYTPIMDMINDPAKYGFTDGALRGCCGTGLMEMGPLCQVVSPWCSNASKFLFWDAVHLTEAAYSAIADSARTDLFPQIIH